MIEKWSTPENKYSHENKKLKEHIDEVKSKMREFLDFYQFGEEYCEIADFLAEYHDYGKLHKNWEIGKKNVGHSHYSYEYLLEKNISFKDELIDPILKFLILKHHSLISRKIGENLGKRKIEVNGKEWFVEIVFDVLTKDKLERSINYFYRNNKEKLINIVDVFGLFKIADIFSAEGDIHIKFEEPIIKEDSIKRLFSNSFDNKRWDEQIKLISLPSISILRAYTGWGKTTAGLLFFVNKDVKKVFYLMPTITSINKFYEKLNNEFKDKVSKYFYFLDTELKDEDEIFSHLFLFENFISPINITTIDQFLLSFLQIGKYYTKRIMFRNAGIIIDEVHLLNPLMLQLVTYFIKLYRKIYNLKVLFMSATLPNSLVKYLKENLEISDSSFLDFSKGYEKKRRVMWKYIDDYIETYIENAVKEKNGGKKVLIIVNTVEKAIKIGKILEEDFKLKYGEDFVVIHARFMYSHRKDKEKWIENNKNKPHILIATQVCEVSLDISYDVLFTELASLPSLVQRFGRVNRYGEITNSVNVYIFKPEVRDLKRYPYSEEELYIAREVIKELEEEKLESEKQLLDAMNIRLSYEILLREIEKVGKKIKMNYWQEFSKFFFSIDVDDERIKKILNYREGFTVMVIPHPNCIEDSTKEIVEKLINISFKNLSFDERRKLFAKIKEIAVPIPVWWLKGVYTEEEKGFPIVDFKDKFYNEKYGFYERKTGEYVI